MGAPGQAPQGLGRRGGIGRLAPDLELGRDQRVHAEHDLALCRAGGDRLAQGVLARDDMGRAGILLVDVDGPLDEGHPQLLQDRAALG